VPDERHGQRNDGNLALVGPDAIEPLKRAQVASRDLVSLQRHYLGRQDSICLGKTITRGGAASFRFDLFCGICYVRCRMVFEPIAWGVWRASTSPPMSRESGIGVFTACCLKIQALFSFPCPECKWCAPQDYLSLCRFLQAQVFLSSLRLKAPLKKR
jgi:hypothetical protein